MPLEGQILGWAEKHQAFGVATHRARDRACIEHAHLEPATRQTMRGSKTERTGANYGNIEDFLVGSDGSTTAERQARSQVSSRSPPLSGRARGAVG